MHVEIIKQQKANPYHDIVVLNFAAILNFVLLVLQQKFLFSYFGSYPYDLELVPDECSVLERVNYLLV